MFRTKSFWAIHAAVLVLMILTIAIPAPALEVNFRSIGTNKNVLYSTGSAWILAGTTTVDFYSGASLPAYIGKGDKLIIDDEEFYILNRESETRVNVQEPARMDHIESGYSITRAFQTIQLWENDREGDLVGEDRLEVGVCYNDGPFSTNRRYSLATIAGSRTDADHYMWLTVAESDRHNGMAGSGVVLDGANRTHYGIRIMDSYTRVEGLEMKRFRRWNGSAAIQVKNAGRILLCQLLIHDFYSPWFSVVGIKGSLRSHFTMRNCIIYDGDRAAVRTTTPGSTALIENCTIYGMTEYGIFEDYGRYVVLNTISMGNRRTDFSIVRGIQGYNISSDATATGPTSFTFLEPADQFISIMPEEENFHLTETADAIDTAVNLAFIYTDDIDGIERNDSSQWDIGADEYRVYSSGIWHVDSQKYGDGTSWETAFETIQQAVSAARPGDEIWVKKGTYLLSSEINVDKAVSIYGCFDGTENQRVHRNCMLHETAVNGQGAVRCFGIDAQDVIIDGFTIKNGNHDFGGGIYASDSSNFTVSNCTFQLNHANDGGGFFSEALHGELINCIFLDNAATDNGGGVYILSPSLNVTNCIFSGNEAGDTYGPGGGAIFNSGSNPKITNCTFSGNIARDNSEGGAIFNRFSHPEITNCILWGNIAGYGPEIVDDEMSSSTVSYTNIDWDGFPGYNGNIREDPHWVDPGANDFHLEPDSPCINAGTNEAPNLPDTDFEGDPRIADEIVDMGADEFRPE